MRKALHLETGRIQGFREFQEYLNLFSQKIDEPLLDKFLSNQDVLLDKHELLRLREVIQKTIEELLILKEKKDFKKKRFGRPYTIQNKEIIITTTSKIDMSIITLYRTHQMINEALDNDINFYVLASFPKM